MALSDSRSGAPALPPPAAGACTVRTTCVSASGAEAFLICAVSSPQQLLHVSPGRCHPCAVKQTVREVSAAGVGRAVRIGKRAGPSQTACKLRLLLLHTSFSSASSPDVLTSAAGAEHGTPGGWGRGARRGPRRAACQQRGELQVGPGQLRQPGEHGRAAACRAQRVRPSQKFSIAQVLFWYFGWGVLDRLKTGGLVRYEKRDFVWGRSALSIMPHRYAW